MNLREFNLEKALSGECEVYTRDGRKVEQLFYFDKAGIDKMNLVCVVEGIKNYYNENGYYEGCTKKEGYKEDLMLAPKLVDRWINVYKDEFGFRVNAKLYEKEEGATEFKNYSFYHSTIKIQVEL